MARPTVRTLAPSRSRSGRRRLCLVRCFMSRCDDCSSSSLSASARRGSRSSRSWCCATNSRSCVARLDGLRFDLPIERSLPPPAGPFRASGGARSSSRRTRCCAGIAASLRGVGDIQAGDRGALLSAPRSANSCALRALPHPGRPAELEPRDEPGGSAARLVAGRVDGPTRADATYAPPSWMGRPLSFQALAPPSIWATST